MSKAGSSDAGITADSPDQSEGLQLVGRMAEQPGPANGKCVGRGKKMLCAERTEVEETF